MSLAKALSGPQASETLWAALACLVLGLVITACTPGSFDKTAAAIATLEQVDECLKLQAAKEEVRPLISILDDAEIDRLEEIDGIHRLICTTYLGDLTAEVHRMRDKPR